MTPAREKQLVDAATRGDQAALGELLEAYQSRIYNVCLRMLSQRDDAAEVAQDTMVKVIQHINQFNGKSALSTWVIRIAMNLSLSRLRRRKVRKSQSLDASYGGQDDDQTTALRHQLQDEREPGPDESVQQDEMLEHLHTALGALEDDLRAVLVLRDIDELDYQSIADVLALPVGTVKSRLFRARLALRHEMLRLCPPEPAAETGK